MEEVKLKYERSLAFFKSSRQEIVDEVQGLRKRQFSCLDECMVQLMECQVWKICLWYIHFETGILA